MKYPYRDTVYHESVIKNTFFFNIYMSADMTWGHMTSLPTSESDPLWLDTGGDWLFSMHPFLRKQYAERPQNVSFLYPPPSASRWTTQDEKYDTPCHGITSKLQWNCFINSENKSLGCWQKPSASETSRYWKWMRRKRSSCLRELDKMDGWNPRV